LTGLDLAADHYSINRSDDHGLKPLGSNTSEASRRAAGVAAGRIFARLSCIHIARGKAETIARLVIGLLTEKPSLEENSFAAFIKGRKIASGLCAPDGRRGLDLGGLCYIQAGQRIRYLRLDLRAVDRRENLPGSHDFIEVHVHASHDTGNFRAYLDRPLGLQHSASDNRLDYVAARSRNRAIVYTRRDAGRD
jgi:hypothetical protein